MKKEYILKLTYDSKSGKCDVKEEFNEEEVVFTIDNKDVICSSEMSKEILKLDNNILGIA